MVSCRLHRHWHVGLLILEYITNTTVELLSRAAPRLGRLTRDEDGVGLGHERVICVAVGGGVATRRGHFRLGSGAPPSTIGIRRAFVSFLGSRPLKGEGAKDEKWT